MAIYHFSAKIVSRARGQSVVASAAYRAGEKLHDRRLGQTFDYTRKEGVAHSEILAPAGAASWVFDRETLWNKVEKIERRVDSQLAREMEIGLPVELAREEQIALLQDFGRRAFVSKGMVVDLALHLDNPENPHAHLLLTTRKLTAEGFGLKQRDWNQRAQLLKWRELWAETANEHLLHAGHEIRIDHRSLQDQRLDLLPGRKIGLSAERQSLPGLPAGAADRVAEQRAIAAENGQRIIDDPQLALTAITHYQATFTERDVAKFLNTRTDGLEQFQAAYLKVTTSPELMPIGFDESGKARFTTRDMFAAEQGLLERSKVLTTKSAHEVPEALRNQVLMGGRLSDEQRRAFEHVTGSSDLAVVVGVAGAGKSTMLESARRAWEAAGYTVKGGALSGIAAENLENASGVRSRTLASWERGWDKGYEALTSKDIFVIDEAGLVGTRQLGRVMEAAEKAQAKVVLIGDPEQLQAIEAGAPFRGIAGLAGTVELTQVRRQRLDWQKRATQQLAAGRTGEALATYERERRIRASETRERARDVMIRAWRRAARERPTESRLMLAYTRADVQELNAQARAFRKQAGELGRAEVVQTARGSREFSEGDRLYFFKNERGLGVKNGSLGTVEVIKDGVLQIRLDGDEGRQVVVDSKQYPHLDHGYAATVHKAQGSTVDRTFVLATPHFDRHAAYVALSRHREAVAVFYGEDDFKPEWSRATPRDNFVSALARPSLKQLAHDYLQDPLPDAQAELPADSERSQDGDEYVQQVREAAVSAWREFRERQREAGLHLTHNRANQNDSGL